MRFSGVRFIALLFWTAVLLLGLWSLPPSALASSALTPRPAPSMSTVNVWKFSGETLLARLEQHQEAPGQVLYKAFATLHDQDGKVWRAIAFNHVLPDGRHNFKLRLVGFPGSVAVDRRRSLRIKTALGQIFPAADDSDHIAIDEGMDAIDVPPNVAQYDLATIASRLPGLVPLRLLLPLEDGKDVRLLVGPKTVQEWKSVAGHSVELTLTAEQVFDSGQ